MAEAGDSGSIKQHKGMQKIGATVDSQAAKFRRDLPIF